MPARALLKRMQASRTQMALVIDEYGGTDGLVSLEDLVEIIVGEIEDEHDLDEEPTVKQVADGVFIADARAELDERGGGDRPGFQGRRQERGDRDDRRPGLRRDRTHPAEGRGRRGGDGFDFEVLDADPRRIKRVSIRDRSKAAAPVRQKRAAAG